MRVLSVIASVLLATAAFAQAPGSVFTPTQDDLDVPTYINATVVRVDTRNDTFTVRSASGEVTLTVEGDALAGLGRLRPGDEVLIGYRMDTRSGRPVQIVTAILGGEQARLSRMVMASTPSPGVVVTTPVTAPSVTFMSTTLTPTTPTAPAPAATTPSSSVLATLGGGGTVGVPAAGTVLITAPPISPYASQVPSLPPVMATLNVVAPPAAAPALAETLPVGAARDIATRDYESAVRTLALKANEIDLHWPRYRDACLRTSPLNPATEREQFGPGRDREWFVLFDGDVRLPADDNCRLLRVEMTNMANAWKDLMVQAEETARSHDVLPGVMREIRHRHRVDF